MYAWIQDGVLCTTGEPENVPEEYRSSVQEFPHLSWPQDADRLVLDGGAIREKTEEEVRQEHLVVALTTLRQERNRRLAETDWVVARAYERGEPVPPAWAAYRQALRDLPAQLTDEQVLAGDILWPEPPKL